MLTSQIGNLALRGKTKQQQLNEQVQPKWTPMREHWEGFVTDDDVEGFGVLACGHEVEVFVAKQRGYHYEGQQQNARWVPGVVLAIDRENGRLAVNTSAGGTPVEIETRQGLVRRLEDGRELCPEQDLMDISNFRARGQTDKLVELMSTTKSVSSRSQALVALVRMGKVREAQRWFSDAGARVTSIAVRELAHGYAKEGDVVQAVQCCRGLPETVAAQLVVESLALALTGVVLRERSRMGQEAWFRGDVSEDIEKLVRDTSDTLQQLKPYAKAVRRLPPAANRLGFTAAFNELLLACGRAMAAPLAFRVLEWMELLSVPKDNFTYEAIGMNVAKKVTLLRKVWDLANAPEEACPEVVFAGRSNVGKSSLVNMLLNRIALAPTSQKPGKTRTMDFFDVNAGHPKLPRFRLVDVPGLGFARASKDLRERWIGLIGGYFIERRPLKLVFHLLDAGLGEILPADRDLWRLLAQAKRTDFELCIALTKADRSLPSQLERFAKKVREALRMEGTDLAMSATIFACSSRSRLGKDTLWRKIWTALGGYDMDGQGVPHAVRYRQEEYSDQDLARVKSDFPEHDETGKKVRRVPPWMLKKREKKNTKERIKMGLEPSEPTITRVMS